MRETALQPVAPLVIVRRPDTAMQDAVDALRLLLQCAKVLDDDHFTNGVRVLMHELQRVEDRKREARNRWA